MAKKLEGEMPGAGGFDTLDISKQACMVPIIGTTPLIMNRLSEKARRELLLPAPPKNRAERVSTLKHCPIEEFRRSVYRVREDDAPTRLVLPSGAFKKCMASAALDIPGATKAQMGRLTSIPMVNVHIFGVPKMFCAIVRQAGINKTPDVRTRAIIPEWACVLQVEYVAPLIKELHIYKLLVTAGMVVGVGDWRSEKGAGSFGSFQVIDVTDKEQNERFQSIMEGGGREQQDEALEHPETYDYETEELVTWFDEELIRRDEAQRSGRRSRVSVAMEDIAASNGDEGDDNE